MTPPGSRGDHIAQPITPTCEEDERRPALPHLVNIKTVAEYLGVNVRYVRRLVADRDIPFIKWRHLLRFDLDVIARWVDQNRHGEDGLSGPTSSGRR